MTDPTLQTPSPADPRTEAEKAAHHRDLAEKEARFWDAQEEQIEELYERPHDWRFVPPIAERIIASKVAFVRRLVRDHRAEIGTLLDVGCGSGWFCHGAAELGIRTIGVDVSGKKIEAARRTAAERGLADLCRFETADVMRFELDEPVDLLAAFGSLHHFPNLEERLGTLVERLLRPKGLMLFCEPNHEGMPPEVAERLLRWANGRLLGWTFDKEWYLEVTGKQALDGPEHETHDERTYNLRGESPAGLEFFGEEPDMGAIVKANYELLEERYFHYMSGHVTNAFTVFQKRRWTQALYRLFLPLVCRWDDRLCRKPEHQKYAEEGVWFLRRRD